MFPIQSFGGALPETQERWWPRAADAEYVRARTALIAAERQLRDAAERVAAMRRALPPGPDLTAHTLTVDGSDGPRAVPLAELFGGHRTLVVYHMMFGPADEQGCPMCGMWLDGLYGVRHHLRRHAALAAVGSAPLPRLTAWARRRGWHDLTVASAAGTAFNADLGAERDGEQLPGLTVLVRAGGRVRHASTVQAFFPGDGAGRGIDPYCVVWPVLDLLPQGRGDWWADSEDYLPGGEDYLPGGA